MQISLAHWSLHRSIAAGRCRGGDLPRIARREFGIDAVEPVNTLVGKPTAQTIAALRRQADSEGVRIVLLMVDDAGDLSHPRDRVRKKAVQHHLRWIDAARAWGASAVRVNTGGRPPLSWRSGIDSGEVVSTLARCRESIETLAEHALDAGISILIENHGGLSANIPAVVRLVESARAENIGTLPDFGNFTAAADKYAAVAALLPHARAVSAKTFDFDASGDETTIDYPRMMGLVRAFGYDGYVGIEYEGERLPEVEGIRLSMELIRRSWE